MKLFLFALIATIFFGTKKDLVENKKFYNHKITDTIKNVDTLLIGDLNSDKIPDTIFRIYPQMINATEDYDGDCVNNACDVTFKFSFTDQQIVIYNAISAGIENLGDINKDGFSEFSIFHIGTSVVGERFNIILSRITNGKILVLLVQTYVKNLLLRNI
jgi:hypothetical protein